MHTCSLLHKKIHACTHIHMCTWNVRTKRDEFERTSKMPMYMHACIHTPGLCAYVYVHVCTVSMYNVYYLLYACMHVYVCVSIVLANSKFCVVHEMLTLHIMDNNLHCTTYYTHGAGCHLISTLNTTSVKKYKNAKTLWISLLFSFKAW
jgi:hypothetical protein